MRARFLLPVVFVLAGGAGCGGSPPHGLDLDEALARFREAFGSGEPLALNDLLPEDGWAMVALSGEPRRSASGGEIRRLLARLFRTRAPVAWRERPDSILRAADGSYVLFAPEWTSLALGTDRLVVERFRIGLERAPGPGGGSRLRIRELTVAWR